MAYADKERLTSLAQGIRDRLLIKDKTEAQALVLSVTYPNCIYYTSDTHCIIVGGHVYGRSNQVSADAPFAYLPADVSSPSADPQFDGNHDTIYIQPIKTGTDAGKIKLWWYVNGAWTSTDTLDLVLPTDAEDITYDLTNTPDLGSGDVQSAIEALDGKVFGEILNKKVVAKNLRNGSPGNLTNTYAVTTYMLPTNGKQSYRFYTTRPNKENCIYHWGHIMSSDASMVGTSQTYGSVSSLVLNSDANKTRSDWSMLVLADIAALAVGIAEYNTSTQSYSPLRIGDFEGYELGFIPIDLPDRKDGLTEQPKFVDEAYEKRGWWLLPGGINTTGALDDTSGNYSQYYYEVSAGDKVMIRNSSNWVGTPSLCYAVYDKTFTKGVRPTDAADHLMPDYSDWRTSSFNSRGNVGQDYDLIIPQDGKTLVVMARITANGTWAAYQVPHVYIQRAGQKAELKDNNYLISTWTDDEIITSTTLAVGRVVPYWSDGTRYGGRGVRLDVKEGDKILLDTYSPALFGLIFTDENRVVKALYDDRRFDGVWTAPVNGYCYIQDVLYRENYHYASAHGHLAYMAHDARKRVAKGGDWYNEYAPRRTQETLPIEVNKTGNAQTYIVGDDNLASWVGIDVGKFVLIATRVYTYTDSAMAGTTLVTAGWHNSTANAAQVMSGGSSAYVSDGYNWGYRIYLVKVNTIGQTFYQAYWNTSSTEKNHHRIDKAYMHSFDNFADAYQLAEKIVHGEVEVDNFYGVREKEVDLVKNAIGLQSISDLGYNILEHGVTLPIDEEGYKYAKEIYDRYKDNPPTGARGLFASDSKLVYMPYIDFTHLNTSSELFPTFCRYAGNLVA